MEIVTDGKQVRFHPYAVWSSLARTDGHRLGSWPPADVSEMKLPLWKRGHTQQAFEAWVWHAEKHGAVAAGHPRLVCCGQQGHASCSCGVPLLPCISGWYVVVSRAGSC